MPRSSARGYVEPVVAIAAVFAVAAGLTIYVGSLGDALGTDDRSVATTVLEDLRSQGATLGVVEPTHLAAATVPPGWHANVTLATADGRWSRGPRPPSTADGATTEVAVRLDPGEIRPGRLTVEAWR